MPGFTDRELIDAPPEEVWKRLHDPARFPEWMDGLGSVEDVRRDGDVTTWTQFPEGFPDFPMGQRLEVAERGRRVVVSCLVSDLAFRWTLAEADDDRTEVGVDVGLPEAEAHRLEATRDAVRRSLVRLAATAGPRARG